MNLRPVAAFYADREGQFDFVNSDWCRLTNCSQAEALGAGWLNAIHAGDRQYVAGQWRLAIRDEKFIAIEFRLASPIPAHVLLQALPQYDGENNHTGYSGTLTALGSLGPPARAKTPLSLPPAEGDESLSATKQRLREAIDLAGLYYFEHDFVAGTTYRSKRLREMFGGNRNMAELSAAMHSEDAPKFWDNHRRCAAARLPCLTEFRVRFPGCEVLQVKSQGLFSYDEAGKVIAVCGFTLPAADWTTSWQSSAIEVLHRIATAPG